MAQAIVYGLCDPCTNNLRYVGYTGRRISQRLAEHIALRNNAYCRAWIKRLLNKGHKPTLTILSIHKNYYEAIEAEKIWLKYFFLAGYQLTNLAKGGRKNNAGWKMTPEQIRKMSLGLRGNKNTLGRKRSEQERLLISNAMKKSYANGRKVNWSKGEQSGKSKITWNDVREIRSRYKNGEFIRNIAKDFPIGKSMVGYIVKEQNWKEG